MADAKSACRGGESDWHEARPSGNAMESTLKMLGSMFVLTRSGLLIGDSVPLSCLIHVLSERGAELAPQLCWATKG